MAFFPFFMDISKMNGLVIGGGAVAARKVNQLLQFGAKLHVVTLGASEELLLLQEQERIALTIRSFEIRDLINIDYVVAASSDAELNRTVADCSRKRRIPVNVVDVMEECSFIFPSLVQDESITIGISTGGNSPYFAKYLKEKVRAVIPEGAGAMAEVLGAFRPMVKARIKSQKIREKIFTEMAELVMGENQGIITEAVVEEIVRKYEDVS